MRSATIRGISTMTAAIETPSCSTFGNHTPNRTVAGVAESGDHEADDETEHHRLTEHAEALLDRLRIGLNLVSP
jgi:hypothetical protein